MLAFAVFASLASCVADNGGAENVPAEGKTIRFTLSSSEPATGAATRGVTRAPEDNVANEDAVNRLDVFFYSVDGGVPLFHPTDAQLDFADGKVGEGRTLTVSIPDDVFADLEGEEFFAYVVANAPAASREGLEGKTLAQLKALVVENSAAMSFNVAAAPSDFLMTGQSDEMSTGDEGEPVDGAIALKRAAAKIVVNVTKASIAGYTPGTVRARITNYLDDTVLDSATPGGNFALNDYKSEGWRSLQENTTVDPKTYHMDVENAIYTYSNDWRGVIEKETYITLEVEWTDQDSQTSRLYYYRIPFSYIRLADETLAAENRDRIRRNHIYQFDVDVTKLGGLDPEDAVDLEANFDVIDWSSKEIAVSIQSFDYLFVYDPVVTTSAASHVWEYRSSVGLGDEEEFRFITAAWCNEYRGMSGTETTVNYLTNGDPPGNANLSIDLSESGSKTYLTIGGWEPVNYVPLEIRATLDNGEGLSVDVSLTIVPEKYVTVSYSNGGSGDSSGRPSGNNPDYAHAGYPRAGAYTTPTGNTSNNNGLSSNNPDISSGVKNWFFYEITTTSLEAQTIRIAGANHDILVGDPTIVSAVNPFGTTWPTAVWIETDPNKQNVVSPRFVMASRRGMTDTSSWSVARQRCRQYREAQYPAGTWRVPTYAELALISVMQNDDDSAIKDLLSQSSGATTWWTALTNYAITPNSYDDYNEAVNQTNTNRNVRCVRDTWKTYPQDDFGDYADTPPTYDND
jgi:hypothetical protein